MNREFFEKRGFTFKKDSINRLYFEKGEPWKNDGYFLEYNYIKNTVKIQEASVKIQFAGPSIYTKFDGLFENEETFNLICKLINLN